MKNEFVDYNTALALKELGFDEPCIAFYEEDTNKLVTFHTDSYQKVIGHICLDRQVNAPTFSQAINFLYICSNKQIDIELKASDSYEERVRKINQGCEDLRNLQNNKSN